MPICRNSARCVTIFAADMENKGKNDRRKVLEFVTAAGEVMLQNGAEVSRTQQTMEIMAQSFGVHSFHGYVLTNGLFASICTEEGCPAQIRSVLQSSVHLGRVEAVNALSRHIAQGKVDLEEAEKQLEQIRNMPLASKRNQVLACGFGSAGFAILFGGIWQDGVIALLVGFLLQLLLLRMEKAGVGRLFTRFWGAAFVAAMTILLFQTGLGANMDKAIIGALMPLVPGMALTLGIRDLIDADFLSGVIRMLDALLTGACIACGTGIVLLVAAYLPGVMPL